MQDGAKSQRRNSVSTTCEQKTPLGSTILRDIITLATFWDSFSKSMIDISIHRPGFYQTKCTNLFIVVAVPPQPGEGLDSDSRAGWQRLIWTIQATHGLLVVVALVEVLAFLPTCPV